MDNTVRAPDVVTSIVNGEAVGGDGHKLPMRPEGTEGMSAEALAERVTRDSMIGVIPARNPA